MENENTSNETPVRELIENWVTAVKTKNIEGVLAHHDPNIVMYDVPEPFQSIGIQAYKETWDAFFGGTQSGVFDIQEMNIIADEHVAFCFAVMKCSDRNKNGEFEDLFFRLTIGLKKIKDNWTIVHEHHSVPSI